MGIKINSLTGGSIALQVDDTLATDEVVTIVEEGFLYKSTDGSSWKLTVDNSGVITMVKVV